MNATESEKMLDAHPAEIWRRCSESQRDRIRQAFCAGEGAWVRDNLDLFEDAGNAIDAGNEYLLGGAAKRMGKQWLKFRDEQVEELAATGKIDDDERETM